MDRVIMPELITPKFAELIAENPEVLKMFVDNQPGEDVIMGQNCTLECGNSPTNVKLVLCNVTIGVEESNTCGEDCNTGQTEGLPGCHIKAYGREDNLEGLFQAELSKELNQLRLEVAVLESKMSTIEKILRMIPRHVINRKLIARCKVDANEIIERLAAMKKKLEVRTRSAQ